jgi:predicted O-methyltransferase YrrM
MKNELWAAVERYYLDLIAKPDPRLQKIIQASDQAGLPVLRISDSLGRFLQLLVKSLQARRILEIGTQGGYSTAWIGAGIPPDGKLISLEIDPRNAELASKNLSEFEFASRVEIRVGDAIELMKEIKDSGEQAFDFIFIDAEKSQYCGYLDASLGISHPGTVIIADNVVKHGRFVNSQTVTPSQIGITSFHEKVALEPTIEAGVLQTVDEKGHDGFTFIVVNGVKDPAAIDSAD